MPEMNRDSYHAGHGLVPSPEDIDGNFSFFKSTAPNRSNIRTMVLQDPEVPYEETSSELTADETSHLESLVKTERRAMITRGEFELNPNFANTILGDIRLLKHDPDWKAYEEDVIKNLDKAQAMLKSEADVNLRDFGVQMNQARGRQQLNISSTGEERFAELIKQMTDERKITTQQRTEIINEIIDIYRRDAHIHADLNSTRNWNDLKPVTQDYVKNFFASDSWTDLQGRKKRIFGPLVRARRRNEHVGHAPYDLMHGAENGRRFMKAQKAFEALRVKLENEENPTKRETMRKQLDSLMDTMDALAVPLADRFDDSSENVPLGKPQVIRRALSEMVNTIDGVRARKGKLVVNPVAPWDRAGWFSESLSINLRSHWAIAHNALERLELKKPDITEDDPKSKDYISGKDEFLTYFAPESNTERPEVRVTRSLAEANKERDQAKLRLEKAEEALAQARIRTEAAHRDFDLADEDKTAIDISLGLRPGENGEIEPVDGGARPDRQPRARGNGNNTQGAAISLEVRRDFRAATRELREAERAFKLTDAADGSKIETGTAVTARKAAEEELGEINNYIEELKLLLSSEITNVEVKKGKKTIEVPYDDAWFKNELAKERSEQYSELIQKLKDFLFPNGKYYGADFYGVFDNREIDLIIKLNGEDLRIITDKTASGKHEPAMNDVMSGKVTLKDGRELKLGYAIVDPGKLIPEQEAKLSTSYISQVFDPTNERFKKLQALKNDVEKNGGVILIGGFSANTDISGGMMLPRGGFDTKAAEQLKKDNPDWTDHELMLQWMDNLEIQKQLGVRPEEVEAHRMAWFVRTFLLRTELFPAKDNWGFYNTGFVSETVFNIETALDKVASSGEDFSGTTLLQHQPFTGSLPERTNEHSLTVVEDSKQGRLGFREQWRDMEMTDTSLFPNAPQNLLDRFLISIQNRFKLYKQRFAIGGQPTLRKKPKSPDEVIMYGAYVEAYERYITSLEATVEKIYNGRAVKEVGYTGSVAALDKLKALSRFYDAKLANVSYDIFDDRGDFNSLSFPQEFQTDWNETRNILGQFKSDLKRERNTYATEQASLVDDPQRPAKIEAARTSYVFAAQRKTQFTLMKESLGKQALGQFSFDKPDSDRSTAEITSGRLSEEIMDELLMAAETLYRARIKSLSPWLSKKKGKVIARRIKGALSSVIQRKERPEVLIRGALHIQNTALLDLTNPLLVDPDPHTIAEWEYQKFHALGLYHLMARIAQRIETGNGRGLEGVLKARSDSNIYDENIDTPSLQRNEVDNALINFIKAGIKKEGADAIDRETNAGIVSRSYMPLKRRGFYYKDYLKVLLHASISDAQHPDSAGYLRLYGKGPDGKEKTKFHELLELLLKLVEEELDRADARVNRIKVIMRDPAQNPYAGGRTTDDRRKEKPAITAADLPIELD
jgi:hypothetical protein